MKQQVLMLDETCYFGSIQNKDLLEIPKINVDVKMRSVDRGMLIVFKDIINASIKAGAVAKSIDV